MTEAVTRYLPGTPCWVSLMVHSLSKSQEFYGELFGWEFHTSPHSNGPYVQAVLNGLSVAGMGEMPPGRELPVIWLPYLATDDADATADLIRVCGGTVGVGPLAVGEAGRYAIATDPTGAAFGIWQSHALPGAARMGGPGAQVWNELITQDTWGVGKFYAAVFGYENEAVVSDEFDYILLHVGGRPVGGIRGVGHRLPRGRGPHWRTYFEVTDTDEAVRKVIELGGQVVRGPKDSPYGRLAQVVDPEGALFTVITVETSEG